MNISHELEKLRHMCDSGSLSEDEYARAKAVLLNPQGRAPDQGARELQSRQWVMFLGRVVPDGIFHKSAFGEHPHG